MSAPTIKAAIEILTTEANQLARLLDAKAFTQMHHRVEIAVQTEMNRLRDIASELRMQLPPEDPT